MRGLSVRADARMSPHPAIATFSPREKAEGGQAVTLRVRSVFIAESESPVQTSTQKRECSTH